MLEQKEKAIEETSGTNGDAVRIQRQVKRSTTSEEAAASIRAPISASGSGTPACASAHTIMPPIMNRPGMLKLRKLSTPMLNVSATATIA